MTDALIIEIMYMTLRTAALLSAPIILTILIVGLLSQILQAVTQMRDMALTFVPKVIATGIVLLITVPWYIKNFQSFTELIFSLIIKARM